MSEIKFVVAASCVLAATACALTLYAKQPAEQDEGTGLPVGTILAFAGSVVPDEYLPADGRLIDPSQRSTVYKALCDTIGDTYANDDDAVGTCRVPDLKGRAPVGMGTYTDSVLGSVTRNAGDTIGAAAYRLQSSEVPVRDHRHRVAGGWHPDGADSAGGYIAPLSPVAGLHSGGGLGSRYEYAGSYTTGVIDAAIPEPHSNMPPSLVVKFIIKAK